MLTAETDSSTALLALAGVHTHQHSELVHLHLPTVPQNKQLLSCATAATQWSWTPHTITPCASSPAAFAPLSGNSSLTVSLIAGKEDTHIYDVIDARTENTHVVVDVQPTTTTDTTVDNESELWFDKNSPDKNSPDRSSCVMVDSDWSPGRDVMVTGWHQTV